MRELTGGCCCGRVQFEVKDAFATFFFCHCEQCRKLTGSAHAANLFTAPENITWLHGQEHTRRYDHPTRFFSKVFCLDCGSALPYLSQRGNTLIVPAGSLNEEPTQPVNARIFCKEQTQWHKQGLEAPAFQDDPSI